MKSFNFFLFFKYTCVGAVGTAFQYMILILLVSTGSTGPVAASSVGAVVGAFINYVSNYYFTFRSSENHSRSAPRFFFIAIVGFCVNWVSMSVLIHVFALQYILAQIVTTGMVLMLTFFSNSTWTFNPKQQ